MSAPRPAAAVCLFRELLRWTRAHRDAAPFVLSAEEVQAAWCAAAAAPIEDAEGVARAVRATFRAASALPVASDASAASLDAAFAALRHLNDTVSPALAARAARRAAHSDRTGVLHSLGTTFRHKKHGYTGVVVGWDAVCARPTAWLEAFAPGLKHGGAQPFYSVLPDARDCAALFGGARDGKYVAQENIEPLTPALQAAAAAAAEPASPASSTPRQALGGIGRRARVLHAELKRYFVGFSRTQGRYIPRRELSYEYPDEADDPAVPSADLEPLL